MKKTTLLLLLFIFSIGFNACEDAANDVQIVEIDKDDEQDNQDQDEEPSDNEDDSDDGEENDSDNEEDEDDNPSFEYFQPYACYDILPDSTFDIITWNIENFPKRDATTIAQVAELINNMNVDLIALQEIDEPSALDALLEALPGWLYKYQDVRYGQEVGFLYKTSEITSISDLQMIYNNESSPFPRQPVLTTVTHSNGQEVTLINIHLKCCGGNENESRREQASILLKKYIDDNLATNKVILLGDFNGEINDANSEFSNFIADDSNYKFADMEIAIGDYEYWSYPNFDPNGSHIDHILITDELFDEVNFVSTMQLDECISSFDYYISDHRPILISLN